MVWLGSSAPADSPRGVSPVRTRDSDVRDGLTRNRGSSPEISPSESRGLILASEGL